MAGKCEGGSSLPRNDEAPVYRGFVVKRLKRFELSTFCMATTATSGYSGATAADLQQFYGRGIGARPPQSTWIYPDMRRFGNFCRRVPETGDPVSIRPAKSPPFHPSSAPPAMLAKGASASITRTPGSSSNLAWPKGLTRLRELGDRYLSVNRARSSEHEDSSLPNRDRGRPLRDPNLPSLSARRNRL
jgi:hypothetical protein